MKKADLRFHDLLKASSLPRLETEILVSFLLGLERETLLTHPETPIAPSVLKKFKELERKRRADWPIAYLTGHKEFFGLDFEVSPAVLTPRPETEMIVEEIVDAVKEHSSTRGLHIIDLGTGSGAIIIAAARQIKKTDPTAFRNLAFKAVEISARAFTVANRNSAAHGLAKKINICKGNLLKALKLNARLIKGKELIIAANLPYLTPAQMRREPSISREPKTALDGGRDGLKIYRELFGQLRGLGPALKATVYCEIDPAQAEPIARSAKRFFPQGTQEIKEDLSGQDRLFILRI